MSNTLQVELVRFFSHGAWIPLAVAVSFFAVLMRQAAAGLAPVPVPVRKRSPRRR
jgi:hypothetical protein